MPDDSIERHFKTEGTVAIKLQERLDAVKDGVQRLIISVQQLNYLLISRGGACLSRRFV